MMKKYILLIVLVCSCTYIFGQQGCCYSSKYLELYPTKSSLYFVQAKNSEQLMKIKENALNNNYGAKIIANLAENAIIVNSKSLGGGNYISDIYQDKEGYKLIMLPRFAIKMKMGRDIEEVLSSFGKRLSFDQKEKNVYKVNCNVDNAEDVLAINTEINSLESVEWCEPMMIGEGKKCNEFAGYQYYIKNTGQNGGTPGIDINVEPVWNSLSVNTSLIVAVLDDGVERNHEDLSGAVLNGMTIDYPNEYGDPINEFGNGTIYEGIKSHGTACAGIIAAKDNSTGVKGVASGVRILPINIHPYSYTTPAGNSTGALLYYEKIGQAIAWAYNTKGADIISCSWTFSYSNYIEDALNNAMVYGRNGKGTIVVCASGNYHPTYGVCFPANMTGTIAVGAINKNGNIWSYSCRGSSLDLVAPSGGINWSDGDIVTTDRTGAFGCNPTFTNGFDLSNMDYTQRFGGTSAACPQVAGVTALMLSANPNLTAGQVKSILQNTARKLSGMDGQNRTDTYGYGLVDANYAVFASRGHEILGSHIINSSNSYSINNLLSGGTVEWSLSDSYYNQNCLQQNYPAQNQCTITRSNSQDMANAILTATIKYNGVTIQTLTKSDMYAHNGFKGTYSSSLGSGQYTAPNPIFTSPSSTVTIYSPNIIGATASYTGDATPTYWNLYYNRITVGMPSTGSTIVVNVHCANGAEYYIPIIKTYNPYYMSVSQNGESMTVTLDESATDDQAWTLEVYNTTGKKIATQTILGRSITFNTSGWKRGLYTIRAIVDKEVLTEKIQIK